MLPILKDIVTGVSHLFYPRLCEGCRKPLLQDEEVLCISCTDELPLTNYHHIADNETAIRFAGRVPFAYASSLAYFATDGLLQHLIHGLKYQKKKEIGVFLGKKLAYGLKNTEWIKNIDMIIPVPLHPQKERERGYNQSIEIGKGMAEVLGKPLMPAALQRVRYTESQTQKSRADRVENMKNAFNVTDKNMLKNKHVLIIDDILTTGATIEACTIAILDISCVVVSIATIGIAID
jgi:ComF family protein